jgi:hypothetical protein
MLFWESNLFMFKLSIFWIALIRVWIVFYISKLIDFVDEFLDMPEIFNVIIFFVWNYKVVM